VLKEVVRSGSGGRAGIAIRRSDLAGKTGTTTGPRDAWFAGFNSDLVAVARVGFDEDSRDLGNNEQGGVTAIPAWIGYMQVMLDGQPEHALEQPTGIIERRINPRTGLIAAGCNRDTMTEYYLLETQPERESDLACFSGSGSTDAGGSVPGGSGAGGGSVLFE